MGGRERYRARGGRVREEERGERRDRERERGNVPTVTLKTVSMSP